MSETQSFVNTYHNMRTPPNLAQLARLTSTALDALAMAYLPEYREKIQGKNQIEDSTA